MITVLRLGHRHERDHRISTHCGLVARALGANKIIYSGERDEKLLDSINNVTTNWGGPFQCSYESNWKKVIRNFRGTRVHLTMYGIPMQKEMRKIRTSRNLLVIIGGEKVPGEVYRMADYNVAVANQPHSEVAALAVFMHDLQRGKELEKRFTKSKLRIIPSKDYKNVVSTKK